MADNVSIMSASSIMNGVFSETMTEEEALKFGVTKPMLEAARDWSQKRMGRPVGNDAAVGIWIAMRAAMDFRAHAAEAIRREKDDGQ